MSDEPTGLTEGERDALGTAYRGPWGQSHRLPDRLVTAVERILAERIAQARREGAAEAWDEGWHAAAQVVDLEGRPVWAHTVMPEGYEGNPYATALRGDA